MSSESPNDGNIQLDRQVKFWVESYLIHGHEGRFHISHNTVKKYGSGSGQV